MYSWTMGNVSTTPCAMSKWAQPEVTPTYWSFFSRRVHTPQALLTMARDGLGGGLMGLMLN